MVGVLYVGLLVAVFVAVVSLSLILAKRLDSLPSVQRRLRGDAVSATAGGPNIVKQQTVTNPILAWVQSASSLSDIKARAALSRDLARAGFAHPAAPVWFVIARFGLAIALPLLFLFSQTKCETP